MAYTNKYQKYLNNKHEEKASFPSFLQKSIQTAGRVVTAAALAGGGYYGFKYLKDEVGAFSKIDDFINGSAFADQVKSFTKGVDYVDAYLGGVRDTVKSSGYSRMFSGRAEDELTANLKNRFLKAMVGDTRPIGSDPTSIEKMLTSVSKDLRNIGKNTLERVRFENVVHEVKGKFKDSNTGDFLEEILEAEKLKNSKLFNKIRGDEDSGKFVEKVLKDHKLHEKVSEDEWMKAYEALMTTLPKHSLDGRKAISGYLKKTNPLQEGRTNKSVVDEAITNVRKQYIKSIEATAKKEGIIQKNIKKQTGYRNLTVGEAWRFGVLESPIQHNKKYVGKNGKLNDMGIDPQGILGSLMKDKNTAKLLEDAYVDPMVFVNKSGSIVDLRAPGKISRGIVNTLGDHVQVPFVNIRPFKMLSDAFGGAKKKAPTFASFRRGSVMPTINNSKDRLGEDYFYFNGRLVNQDGGLVRDNVFILSAHQGPTQRSVRNQAGFSFNPKIHDQPDTIGGNIKKWLGIGYQDFESTLSRKLRSTTKFWDKEWQRNIYNDLKEGTSFAKNSGANVQNAFKSFFNTVDNNTKALDRDTFEYLSNHLDGVLDSDTVEMLTKGSREDATMKAIYELINKDNNYRSRNKNKSSLAYRGRLDNLLKDFMEDPSSFSKPFKTFKHSYEAAVPDFAESLVSSSTDILTKLDEAEKLLHAELLHQIESNAARKGQKYTVSNLVKDMMEQGASESQVSDVRKLEVHKIFQESGGSWYMPGQDLTDKGDMQERFVQFISNPSSNQQSASKELENIIKKANPIYGYGPGQQYSSPFTGNDFIVVNESINPFKTMMADINQTLTQGGDILDVFKTAGKTFWRDGVNQLGFGGAGGFGRDNLDKVTGATNMAHHYLLRLNEGLGKIGLALPSTDLGSTQDIAKNLFLKRVLAPLAAINTASYINDEIGNLTGERPTEVGARSYANITVGVQTAKEITGINAIGRHLNRMLPGANRLAENPIGMGVKIATFGTIGENRSPQEMREYYRTGVDPVRRGRFWSIGSSTPIYGGRIKYYQPNWYRRIQADPMMTDSMYGSTSEYWSQHWMPNPRNPLGFLKPGRQYHWVNKHWEDRPYPTTSSGLEAVPLVGPMLDATAGRLFVPFRRRPGLAKAHREYLEEINNLYTHYASKENSGGYMYVTAGGRMTPSQLDSGIGDILPGNVDSGASWGVGVSAGYGRPQPVAPIQDGEVRIVNPTQGFGPMQSGSVISRGEITAANQGIVSKAYVSPSRSRNIQSLRDNAFVDSLRDAADPNSLGYRLGQTYYSATEIGGIYGFALTSATGDLGDRRPVLQSAQRMTGLQRTFWDQEMGGLGGELSEIYRRFLPHRRRQIKEYNPFRNKMPDWMPGPEYFTDFKHGDPYVKTPKGEYRLPGAGYESLNQLHSDFFGRYGAIDRFKILADIAPYSDQYRYYSSVVSRMKNAGMIDENDYEQVKQIRELVSKQGEKHDFHRYKFKYADIDKKEVTVLRWINKDTFLTKEYPGNPIKLAGISMPSNADDSSQAQIARDLLHKYVSPGSKVKVGIDADALNRVRDDSMGTMHGVVYDKSGTSINARLARMSPIGSAFTGEEGPVKADWDDTSATATHALYYQDEIKMGKAWESFAHLDTPIHTKLMQVRSPLEMYKRKELYGKSWQTWSHPIRDWLKPTFEKFFSWNPVVASIAGGGIGALAGIFTGSKKVTATVGALVGGLGASARTVGEMTKRSVLADRDYTWIPKRRREERSIDEYFDVLKYVKYRGLYEAARKTAIKHEGIDPEEIVNKTQQKGQSTSYLRNRLEGAKKWLSINKTDVNVARDEMQTKINSVNRVLNNIAADREIYPVGPLTMKALQYKKEYESTLYGADPNGDLMDIYRALPKKDKPFFKHFMTAAPEEREEILRLVPKNQKRFYQAKWGLQVDRKPTLTEFFATHRLPDVHWEGWQPEYSIDEIKVKFLKNEGLELGEFGYWEDDAQHAADAPRISKINTGGLFDIARLEKILLGAGIKDVDITTQVVMLDEKPPSPYSVNVNMSHDRRPEITQAINSNIASFI